ncbi:hypothetical protein D3C81_847850 [compost metagenome]
MRKHLCVSCYNREREYLIGRNAKGSKPVMHPPLMPLAIRFRAGETQQTLAIEHAVSMQELIVAALRDTSKQVTFGFQAKRAEMPQGELFV